jgi:hypothetical protein
MLAVKIIIDSSSWKLQALQQQLACTDLQWRCQIR